MTTTTPMPPLGERAGDLAMLQQLCEAANRIAFVIYGVRDTCITTSAALQAALAHAGIATDLVRVRASVIPRDRATIGAVLGSDGDGPRLLAARPGYWPGHLVVVTQGGVLLDATVDQVNEGNPALDVRPLALAVPAGFLVPHTPYWEAPCAEATVGDQGTRVRYQRYPRQVGWRSAPAFRRCHWWPVAAPLLDVGADQDQLATHH